MIRNVFIFLGTFVVGALIALMARASLFDPHKDHGGPAPAREHAPMVTNHVGATSTASEHAGHGTSATERKTVNSVCAICGMEVDPNLPTLEYQGKTIGFGCRMCAPKFKADPDRYGPLYLRNEVIKK